MSHDGPRHFSKGGGNGNGGGSRRSRPDRPDRPPGRPAVVPPRLRESERLRERMRAQRLGDPADIPPPPSRPQAGPPERRLPAWVVPALLGAGAFVFAVAAFMLDRDGATEPVDAAAPTTPVLSARRVPELIAAPVANGRLQADLSQWLATSPTATCLAVKSGSETLFAQKAGEPLVGASTQKLVTGTAALIELGPDARLDTVASAAAPPAGGIVEGDLYIVGAGDPILTTPAYAQQLYENRQPSVANDPGQLADAIEAAGVTHIRGSVVGDGSRYDDVRLNPRWPARFQGQNVVGQLGALMIDDGYSEFPAQWSGPGQRVPSGDAARHAAEELTGLLRERGVVVEGAPESGTAPSDMTLTTVATLPSATVEEIVGEMLVESDNDTAEMLLKELGRRDSGVGSWEAGAAAVGKILQEAGVDVSGAEVVDGSGLSTENRVSCALLMDLITRPGSGPMLVDHSSVAGKTGTLLEVFKGTPIEGRLHAKTGTLNTVTALAGRADPAQGGSLMFSYIANDEAGISGADAEKWQREVADILVGYPRGVDIAALLPAPVEGAAAEAEPAGPEATPAPAP